MSITLNYLPNPGLLTDSVTALSLKLQNTKKWHGLLRNPDQKIDEISYVTKQLAKLPPPPQELLIFFYKPRKNMPHYTAQMLVQLQKADIFTLSLDTIQSFFKDQDSIVYDIISYYLGGMTPFSDYKTIINTSSVLPKNLKSPLIDFVHDPGSFLSLLFDFITQYYQILKEEHLPDMESAPATLLTEENFNELITLLFPPSKATPADFQNHTVYYSYCHLIRNYLYFSFEKDINYLIMGSDFRYIITSLADSPSSVMLHSIATALSDLNRIRILRYLQQHPAQSKQDLCMALHLSATNAHYHIQVLKDAHLISEKRAGRSILYDVNLSGFSDASTLFNSIAERKCNL